MTGLLVSLILIFGWNLQYLAVDFEFEKFFPRNHPDTEAYAKHVKQFGYDNDYLHVILENKGGVFDEIFLKKAAAFEA